MNSIDFVKEVRKVVLEENFTIYKDLFENSELSTVTNNYWKEALSFFHKLDADSKKIFFEILRQIEVDTISNIFGVLDGVSRLEGQQENFKLVTENSTEAINGELQDRFLELEENN
jgi:hypothetical protein